MTELAFVLAALEAPPDDATRLVFADWLDEQNHGDRAALLRVRASLAALSADDSRREALVQRERKLSAGEHRWLDLRGIPVSWDTTVALIRRRMGEAAAWRTERRSFPLDTPGPTDLLGSMHDSVWQCRPLAERENAVEIVAAVRAALLRRNANENPGGRLLLFDPDGTLSDGTATLECPEIFDGHNVPARDFWLLYAGEQDADPARWKWFDSFLLAWVPPELVAAADRGVRVTPDECLLWADQHESPVLQNLRAAGLFE